MKKQGDSGFLSQLIENTWRADPVLPVSGTDQTSESFIWIEVRPLRRACRLKGILSSHLQRITALHVHMDRQYIYFFPFILFSFSCNIMLSLLFIYSSVYYPVIFSAEKSA